jgi:hypothetical protein
VDAIASRRIGEAPGITVWVTCDTEKWGGHNKLLNWKKNICPFITSHIPFLHFPITILLARRVLADGTYKIIDAITNKLYDYTFVRGVPAKNMQLLFRHPDYKNKFNKNATILIDDLIQNIIINKPHNVIKISGWAAKTYCDALTHLKRWLELNCTRRTFANLEMPILDKTNKFTFKHCNTSRRTVKGAKGASFKKYTRRC